MTMSDPTPKTAEQIEIGGGWHFRPAYGSFWSLRMPNGNHPPIPWTEEDARAFVAALTAAQAPAVPQSDVKLVDALIKECCSDYHSAPTDHGVVAARQDLLDRMAALENKAEQWRRLAHDNAAASDAKDTENASLRAQIAALKAAGDYAPGASETADDALFRRNQELTEIADGAYGDGPRVRGAARDLLRSRATRPTTAGDAMEGGA